MYRFGATLFFVLSAISLLPAPATAQNNPIALGGTFTCSINSSGGVQCWGMYNGLGSYATHPVPTVVSGLDSDIVAVVSGYAHTCALTAAGAMLCFGDDVDGALGNGFPSVSSSTPVPVLGMGTGVKSIATGQGHSCAVTAAGAVSCWGSNGSGQLGNGTKVMSHGPVAVTGLSSGIKAVAAGAGHTCALTTGGGVLCWGLNNAGQLGDNTETERLTPVPVTGLASGVAAITAGTYQTCALTTAGAVFCWGEISGTQVSSTPVPVTGLSSGISQITAGNLYTCALATNGAAKCWGKNDAGQLGDGTTSDRSTPVLVTGLISGVQSLQAGYRHTCAYATATKVQCWGDNYDSELGDGTVRWRLTPSPVVGLSSGIKSISAGRIHSCALTTAGAVQCWGNNFNGQLGDGTGGNIGVGVHNNQLTPVPVSGLNSGVQAISTGSYGSCALNAAGGVQCWGHNYYGQLGDGTQDQHVTPVDVIGLASGIKALSIGDGLQDHYCAINTTGALSCWGFNTFGQLGDGTKENRLTPVPVTGLGSGVKQVATALDHSCALTTAGAVFCWGRNAKGAIGDGTQFNERLTPVAVSGMGSGVQAIAVTYGSSCALTASGAVQCWGPHLVDAFDHLTPTPVVGLGSGVKAISAGKSICALTTAGAMLCWGVNQGGELGDGTLTARYAPTQVSGLASGVQAISAGNSHTCAVTAAGGAKCWGSNGFGQLGDGTPIFSPVPVSVVFPLPLSIADMSVSEGNSGTKTMTFTVSLSAALNWVVTYDIGSGDGTAIAGSDYVATTLAGESIPAGQTSKTFAVAINGDVAVEPNETFSVFLLNPNNATIADDHAVGTITNDDGPKLSINNLWLAEGNSGTKTATFTVSLSEVSASAVTFTAATANGTATSGSDYTAKTLTGITIPAGQLSVLFTVTTTGELAIEANETFFVNLSAPTNATILDAQGQGTLLNDDGVALSVGDAAVSEGDAGTKVLTFTVQLTKAAAVPVTYTIATANGTAAAGSDYVARTLTGETIPAGQIMRTFSVTLNGDTAAEADETFAVNLSAATGATILDNQGIGTLTNDDTPTVSIADVQLAEGNSGTKVMTFTVLLSKAVAAPVTYTIATANATASAGSDYVAKTLVGETIAAGQTSRTFTVTLNGDTTAEANEWFTATLSSVSGVAVGDGQALGVLVNDEGPTLSVNDVGTSEGNLSGKVATFTVTLSQVSAVPVSFTATTANSTALSGYDYIASTQTNLQIPAGQLSRTVEVVIYSDNVVEPNEYFKLNLSAAVGATISKGSGFMTLVNDDGPLLRMNDVSISEGNAGTKVLNFTVSLAPVANGPVTFDIATVNGTAAAGSDYVARALVGETIAAGVASKTFAVTINGDTAVEANETIKVNLTNAVGATIYDSQGLGTITNDD